MSYLIRGLDPSNFSHLWQLDDAELADHRAVRIVVDEEPGFPDRISLRDAPVGAR